MPTSLFPSQSQAAATKDLLHPVCIRFLCSKVAGINVLREKITFEKYPWSGQGRKAAECSLGSKCPATRGRGKGPLRLLHSAHTARSRLVCGPFWEEPMVGVPSEHPACPTGDHPDLHGPADHGRNRQQEGEQAEGKSGVRSRSTTSFFPQSQKKQRREIVYKNFGPLVKQNMRSEDWSSGVCVGGGGEEL